MMILWFQIVELSEIFTILIIMKPTLRLLQLRLTLLFQGQTWNVAVVILL